MDLQRATLDDLLMLACPPPDSARSAVLTILLWIEVAATEVRTEGLRVRFVTETMKPTILILAVRPYGLYLPQHSFGTARFEPFQDQLEVWLAAEIVRQGDLVRAPRVDASGGRPVTGT
jgi:hypothetical protein